jgi:hypothetical protein
MNGSPKATDAKFSYRDAVLKGVAPPPPSAVPSKTFHKIIATRNNG